MARRNSRFVNQKVIVGNKSIQASDLTDSARDTLSVDSDFVKDVLFKLDSNFVNSGFGLDGASIQDSSITADKFSEEVAQALLSGLDSDTTVSLIYPGGAIYKVSEYTPNSSTNSYSVSPETTGAFVFIRGATGGGGGSTGPNSGAGGGGAGGPAGGFLKLSRSELESVNIIEVGVGGNGGNGSVYGASNAGNAGGVTRISTGNASLIQTNGSSGGGRSNKVNWLGIGQPGGNFEYDSTNPGGIVRFFSYNGNSGGTATYTSGGVGGNAGKSPELERLDFITGMALFRITTDSDELAREVLDAPNIIATGGGGRGAHPPASNSPGQDGVDGQIIMWEFN